MGEGKNLVGVDIGSSSIKVCQIKESRKGRILHKLAYAPLPPQTIVDGHIMNAGAVTDALVQIFAEHKIKQKNISLGMSGQAVIIRKISVPMMSMEELDEQIQWEAEQHIPFEIRDVQIDYQVLRQYPDRGLMDLLLVAAKRDDLAEFTQFVKDANLKPFVIEVDSFSVQNLFEISYGLPSDQSIVLLNVGASLTSVNVVDSGMSVFTRDITTAGNFISEKIQKEAQMSFEQAETYKCGDTQSGDGGTGVDHGGMVPQQVQKTIETACDEIAAEIQRSLDFCMATTGVSEVKQVYLTGGTSNLSAVRTAIERRVHVPVEVFNPTERMVIDPKTVRQDLLDAKRGQFAVAIGLGLRKEKEKRS